MDWTGYLFRFDGRINRALFWQALLIILLLAGLLGLIGQAIHVLNGQRSFTSSLAYSLDFDLDDLFKVVDPRAYRLLPSVDRPTLVLKAFGTSLFLWIYLAAAIKRLHDRDRSGWWIVPFFVVPGLFSQFSDLLPDVNWVLAIVMVMQISWLWGFVEMFCLRGSLGSNRFGPDPLSEVEDNAVSTPPSQKSWDQQSELEIVPPSASPPGGMHVKRST
jgi:uncharacterized membrane protein YhaH (DUF805 family)